jgi:hypothetical protein
VGSLLRSDAVKDARSGFAAEAISAEALKAVEDARSSIWCGCRRRSG